MSSESSTLSEYISDSEDLQANPLTELTITPEMGGSISPEIIVSGGQPHSSANTQVQVVQNPTENWIKRKYKLIQNKRDTLRRKKEMLDEEFKKRRALLKEELKKKRALLDEECKKNHALLDEEWELLKEEGDVLTAEKIEIDRNRYFCSAVNNEAEESPDYILSPPITEPFQIPDRQSGITRAVRE